ncbi:MAG: cupin domain-containing protein, partial [Gammaproteobacteria bacterium]
QRLDSGEGIFGTQFVFDRVFEAADHRPHNISIVHRSGYTQPEIHETKWDIYVILDGSGTAHIGGARVGWVDGRAVEQQRPQLQGAREYQVSKGDILHVPARVWHQVVTPEDTSITYALINIFEWEE